MTDQQIKEFEERFPKLEKAIEYIDYLKKIDLRKISLDDLDKQINEFFPMISYGTAHIPKGTLLYRARPNQKDRQFSNIKEITLKDENEVDSFGRANQPNESIFYSASTLKLACCEVLQNLKYSFNPNSAIGVTTVGVWRALKDIHVAPIYYSENACKVREDILEYKKGNMTSMRERNHVSNSVIDVSDLIMEFFADEFSKNPIEYPEQYKYSVSYTRRIRKANSYIAPQHRDKCFDGIVYPSVAMKFKGDNIALFNDDLYSKIELETAYEVICTNFDFENGDLKSFYLHKMKTMDKEGNIKWENNVYGQ